MDSFLLFLGKVKLSSLLSFSCLALGIYVGALEEWAEASIFFSFIARRRLPRYEDLKSILRVEEYLGGLMDFTGELNR